MQAGRLTETIHIYRDVQHFEHTFGTAIINAGLLNRHICRAAVTSLNGTLAPHGGEYFWEDVVKIEVHYFVDLKPGYRISRHQDSIWYEVISVNNTPALRRLTATARRIDI